MAKTIIISNRLPVNIKKDDDKLVYLPSAGGLATGLGCVYKEGDNIWLGWPGIYPENEEEAEEIKTEISKESMRPVYLSEQDIKEYYEGFSNSTLWPLFHYFTQYAEYNESYWDAYKRVNAIFCEELLKYAEDDDTIWIHDYQLLLLPEMVRERLPNASIGFFNHIPFPSFEIFRCLPWRNEIVKGLLGADLIGFHTYDDMRHFLSCVSRISGLDHEMGHFKYHNRMITVDALPMGIDYNKYAEAVISKDTQKEIKGFYSSLNTKRLILSIDRLDYSKGIPQRLHAFDAFLDKYPEFLGEVSLILLVVPSRDNVEHYIELKEEIELLVGRINGKYSRLNWNPIHFFYRALPFHQLSALYAMADVALVTPLRDGMNLVCKEYIASRLDKTGVLILSEMAGSAKELSDALMINPNDKNQIVDSIYQALNMPEEEQIRRNTEMQNRLKRYDIHNWVAMFMQRLNYTKQSQQDHVAKHINDNTIKNVLLKDYMKAEKRLFLLDYDGTLVGFHERPEMAVPNQELHDILSELTKDPKNHVVAISGRDRHFLQKHLGRHDIEFVAEHGVWIKEKGEDWHMFQEMMTNWKDEILPILELYVDRTPGSHIEYKDYSLVWHYRKTDSDFGDLRARELISNLQYLTINMDIQILEGNKVVEIKNSGVNKGKAAYKWIGRESWDFITAMGDDWTDEDTFKACPKDAYTIKVGLSSTDAKYNIKSVEDVRALLALYSKY